MIERLTAEQEARLPIYREEMRAKGLRLQWADDETMRSAVRGLYSGAGLKEPNILVLPSPALCLSARAALRQGQLGDQLWDQLWGQVEDLLRDQLEDQLCGQLRGKFWGQLGAGLGDGSGSDRLGDQLRNQLRDQLEDQLWDQLRGKCHVFQSTWFAGGSENYWISFYRFAEAIGVQFQQSAWLEAWAVYGESCGALYPYDGWAFVSRRPTALHFDERRVLHCESGPAMGFEDGFSIHAWHGVRVPAEWIEETDSVSVEEILRTENVEQRAAGVAIFGMERFLDKLDHKIIDSDEDPERGDLIQVRLPDIPRPGTYLRALCPRNGRIMEAVNPEEMEEMTVKAAQAWRLGIPVSEFTYPEKRT